MSLNPDQEGMWTLAVADLETMEDQLEVSTVRIPVGSDRAEFEDAVDVHATITDAMLAQDIDPRQSAIAFEYLKLVFSFRDSFTDFVQDHIRYEVDDHGVTYAILHGLSFEEGELPDVDGQGDF